MSPVGARTRLEVAVGAKAYVSASGVKLATLEKIAFTLETGAVAAIVGPSGCGKTTLLRLIAGLDADFEGHIARPEPGRLAVVFQEPRLLAWRTVEDNIRIVAPDVADAQLEASFETLGLGEHRTHFPGELSLGLARRVALARALAVNPTLLLLDEPFASLDGATVLRLIEEIKTLVAARPMITLFVTHDISTAISLADRVFVLSARPATLIDEIVIAKPRQPMSAEAASDFARRIGDAAARAPSGQGA